MYSRPGGNNPHNSTFNSTSKVQLFHADIQTERRTGAGGSAMNARGGGIGIRRIQTSSVAPKPFNLPSIRKEQNYSGFESMHHPSMPSSASFSSNSGGGEGGSGSSSASPNVWMQTRTAVASAKSSSNRPDSSLAIPLLFPSTAGGWAAAAEDEMDFSSIPLFADEIAPPNPVDKNDLKTVVSSEMKESSIDPSPSTTAVKFILEPVTQSATPSSASVVPVKKHETAPPSKNDGVTRGIDASASPHQNPTTAISTILSNIGETKVMEKLVKPNKANSVLPGEYSRFDFSQSRPSPKASSTSTSPSSHTNQQSIRESVDAGHSKTSKTPPPPLFHASSTPLLVPSTVPPQSAPKKQEPEALPPPQAEVMKETAEQIAERLHQEHQCVMKASAERARLRKLQEEEEREKSRLRALHRAKLFESQSKAAVAAATAAASSSQKSTVDAQNEEGSDAFVAKRILKRQAPTAPPPSPPADSRLNIVAASDSLAESFPPTSTPPPVAPTSNDPPPKQLQSQHQPAPVSFPSSNGATVNRSKPPHVQENAERQRAVPLATDSNFRQNVAMKNKSPEELADMITRFSRSFVTSKEHNEKKTGVDGASVEISQTGGKVNETLECSGQRREAFVTSRSDASEPFVSPTLTETAVKSHPLVAIENGNTKSSPNVGGAGFLKLTPDHTTTPLHWQRLPTRYSVASEMPATVEVTLTEEDLKDRRMLLMSLMVEEEKRRRDVPLMQSPFSVLVTEEDLRHRMNGLASDASHFLNVDASQPLKSSALQFSPLSPAQPNDYALSPHSPFNNVHFFQSSYCPTFPPAAPTASQLSLLQQQPPLPWSNSFSPHPQSKFPLTGGRQHQQPAPSPTSPSSHANDHFGAVGSGNTKNSPTASTFKAQSTVLDDPLNILFPPVSRAPLNRSAFDAGGPHTSSFHSNDLNFSAAFSAASSNFRSDAAGNRSSESASNLEAESNFSHDVKGARSAPISSHPTQQRNDDGGGSRDRHLTARKHGPPQPLAQDSSSTQSSIDFDDSNPLNPLTSDSTLHSSTKTTRPPRLSQRQTWIRRGGGAPGSSSISASPSTTTPQPTTNDHPPSTNKSRGSGRFRGGRGKTVYNSLSSTTPSLE